MEFAPSEHEPCVRCLQLGMGLCQPDFVGARVDGEEEIALMDDVPILEVYSGKRAADLGAQLNLLDRGKLTKEAHWNQPRAQAACSRRLAGGLWEQRRLRRSDDTNRPAMQSGGRKWPETHTSFAAASDCRTISPVVGSCSQIVQDRAGCCRDCKQNQNCPCRRSSSHREQ